MRGILILSALISAACGYKIEPIEPEYSHQHPPEYGTNQFYNPDAYQAVPSHHNEYPEDYGVEYYRNLPYHNEVNAPGYQNYWGVGDDRVVTPSRVISNGYLPREILHFREMFKILRNRYPGLPLFDRKEFFGDGNYPGYPVGQDGREGKFLDMILPPWMIVLFGGGGAVTTQVVSPPGVSLTDHCETVCGNNEGICMDCATCVSSGGKSIGANCNPNLAGFCCCKLEFSSNGFTDSPISFFKSPGFPSPMNAAESFSLSVTIMDDMDQLLIEFTTFEMTAGPPGCSDSEYFEIISSSYSGGVVGPDNSRFCGMNTDQHLYLDVTPGETVILKAVFAGNGFSWEVDNNNNYYYRAANSRFDIKIIQIVAPQNIPQPDPTPNCILHLHSPPKCLQYYSEMRGTFMNFNYDGRTCMPPNLDYRVCFAHPENYCGINFNALVFDIPTNHTKCMDGKTQVDSGCLCCTAEMDRNFGKALNFKPEWSVQKYLGLDGTSDGSTRGITYVDNQYRYFFCGNNFGRTNFVSSEARGAMVAQVYSDAAQCSESVKYIGNGLGFKIRYNINAGNC